MDTLRDPISHTDLAASSANKKLNWLRAAVLGANDGIVSVSAVIVGVAGASHDKRVILTAGVAALVAGALSMALGEYISVSSQRDTEKALLKKQKHELVNPSHAAFASGIAFFCGAIIPMTALFLAPASLEIIFTFIAVFIALIITGVLSAHAGGANKLKATLRVLIGGILAMIITFGIGKLFGVVV